MTSQTQAVQPHRSLGLKAIVVYKGLAALGFVTISVVSALSWKYYDTLSVLLEANLIDSDFPFSDWLLKTALNLPASNLRWVAHISAVYAIGLGIATLGLWYVQRWAQLLMVVMAGLPIPLEVGELLHGLSWQRLVILLLNLAVVGYLLSHRAPKAPRLKAEPPQAAEIPKLPKI